MKVWDHIAASVGHLDMTTTRRYIHFMPKDKRTTVAFAATALCHAAINIVGFVLLGL
jgi:hypothetical protein